MSVFKAIKKRRSVRSYKEKLVPEESLKKILEAARLAPSAHNEQEWKFIVVKSKEKREKLAKAALNQSFIAQAPVIIVGVALNPEEVLASNVPNYALDLAIAVDHMSLVATEEGLGSCWIGAFFQDEVKSVLEIPKNYKVVVLLCLGYPADSPGPKKRKDIDEIVCHNNFQ